MHNRIFYLFAIILLSTLSVGTTSLAAPDTHKYMGAATCASSNCHGSGSPRSGSNILQDEYVTWSKKDAHSKAWRVLTNEDSKKIGFNLGIKDPSKDPLCLKCHSTYVSEKLHGDKFAIEDGVSCENCHGPAEKWLSSHASSKTSHSDNIDRGMTDLVSVESRAKFCLSCHFGNDDKFVDHRMIGAGHPRLSFELDTFSMTQPRHWDYDQDYVKRKGEYDPIKAWLIGQIEISIASVKVLSSEARSRKGIWPELSLFNCYACHHSLEEGQWRKREYKNGPGELKLNVSSLLVIKDALAVLEPSLYKSLEQNLALLHEQYKEGKASNLLSTMETLLTDQAYHVIRTAQISETIRSKLLKMIVNIAATTPHFQYEEAEQVLMGISAILSSDKETWKKLSKEIDQMYLALKTPEEFSAEDFTAASKKLQQKLL